MESDVVVEDEREGRDTTTAGESFTVIISLFTIFFLILLLSPEFIMILGGENSVIFSQSKSFKSLVFSIVFFFLITFIFFCIIASTAY